MVNYYDNVNSVVIILFNVFLGQHEAIQAINNYFSISDLEYYTKTQGKGQRSEVTRAITLRQVWSSLPS